MPPADRFEPAPAPNAILRLPTTFCPLSRPIAIKSVRSLVVPCTLFTPAFSPIEIPPVVAAVALRPNATVATRLALAVAPNATASVAVALAFAPIAIAWLAEAMPFAPIAIAFSATALDESPNAMLEAPVAKLDVPKARLFVPSARFAPLLNKSSNVFTCAVVTVVPLITVIWLVLVPSVLGSVVTAKPSIAVILPLAFFVSSGVRVVPVVEPIAVLFSPMAADSVPMATLFAW